MTILYLHGWHSVPGGVKPTFLAEHGHTVQAGYDQHQLDVIVASSRGGAVAMNIEPGDTPLVLLCPTRLRAGM